MINRFILAGFLILFFNSFLFAEQYSFSSDFLKSVMAEGREKTLLEGNVVVQSDKKRISADRVEILGKDFQFFICEGDVEVEDLEKDFTLTSEVFHYDNDNRIIRINGPSMMEDRENEMIIKSSYLENREKEDLIIMQVGVRILKEDLACRSEYAVYDRASNTLELTGLPVVYRKDDVFRASRITVNLDNDEISMEGVVQGSLLSQNKDDEKDESDDPASEEQDSSEESADESAEEGKGDE
ncbi:MAG: LptA/OstA family protein [Spirochaetales bacterium]|nr:LptA/OstA family protein [Spirochaetales bacterium]